MRRATIRFLPLLFCLSACTPAADSGDNSTANSVEEPPLAAAAAVPLREEAPAYASAAPETESAWSLTAFLRQYAGDGDLRYLEARADLNDDGQDEIVVYPIGPSICGSGGCNLLVLTPDGSGYRTVMDASVSQLPIRLLPESSNGWRDLSVAVAGGGLPAGAARMRFDGAKYPSNPTVEEQVDEDAGSVLIADDFDAAKPLP